MEKKLHSKIDSAFNKGLDSKLAILTEKELKRQQTHVELIASENYVSPAVLSLGGSVLTNKYAEGYPGARYYNGCENIDAVENLAIERLQKLFDCGHEYNQQFKDDKGRIWNCKKANTNVNVQPHSGSQANAAAYGAVLKPFDIILGMELDAGGHLTHGYKINFSGKIYHGVGYGVDSNELINYQEVMKIAQESKPSIIVVGASAYSRTIDFAEFRIIAEKVGAYLLADIAHIAGLIVTNCHPNPVCHADIITTTTHKTLRGPRGGAILSTEKLAKKINASVFPGIQGGPLEHIIAAKAQAFYEALQPDFVTYQQQIIKNSRAFAKVFINNGLRVIAGGTDNHLFTIDVTTINGLTGEKAVNILENINIIANKNAIPFDKLPPKVASGVRFGTPAMTTRGFKEQEFQLLANIIIQALKLPLDDNTSLSLEKLKNEVTQLLLDFPIY